MRTDIFISRPILSTVLAMIVVIAGAVAIPTIPIARFPELAPPSVTVAAIYTGANAQAVESAVTTPLEQVINGVQGMTYLQSSSTNSGMSTITVTFSIDRDPDLAAIDVQNRVNQALGRMPADVRTNGISVIKNTSGFMGGSASSRATTATTPSSSATTSIATSATPSSACPASATSSSSASAATRCGCGSIPASWRRAASPPATSSTRCASRTSRSRPVRSATRRPPPIRCST